MRFCMCAFVICGFCLCDFHLIPKNSGQITCGQDGQLAAPDIVNSSTGVVWGGRKVDAVAAHQFLNEGHFGSDQTLIVKAGGVKNNEGASMQSSTMTLKCGSDLKNGGQLLAASTLTCNSANFDNNSTGLTWGRESVGITAANHLLNEGHLGSGQVLTVEAGGFQNNRGGAIEAGASTIKCRTDLVNNGQILNHGNLKATCTKFQNGGVVQGATADVSASDSASITGTMKTTSSAQITSPIVTVGPSGVLSSHQVVLNGKEVHVNNVVHATGTCRLDSPEVKVAGNAIIHAGVLELTGPGQVVEIQSGGVVAARDGIISGPDLTIIIHPRGLLYSGGWWRAGMDPSGGSARTGRVVNRSGLIDIAGDANVGVDLSQENVGFDTDLVVAEDRQIEEWRNETYRRGGGFVGLFNGGQGELTGYTVYNFRRLVYKPRVTVTNPARFIVGGRLHFEGGALENDKSHIIASSVSGNLELIRNGQLDAIRQGHTDDEGWKQRHFLESHHRSADLLNTITIGLFGDSSDDEEFWEEDPRQSHTEVTPGAPEPLGVVLLEDSTPPPLEGTESKENVQSLLDRNLSMAVVIQGAGRGSTIRMVRPELLSNPARLLHMNGILLRTPDPHPCRGPLMRLDSRLVKVEEREAEDVVGEMIKELGPSTVRRYGDKHLDRLLVRNQIAELTGNLVLPEFATAGQQFTALAQNGVRAAQQMSLRIGEPLTSEQIQSLKLSILWLVRQRVQLPDATEHDALIPAVYLVNASSAMAAAGHGGMISAREIDVDVAQGVENMAGLLHGQTRLKVGAESLLNEKGGTIASGGVAELATRTNLSNVGATITAVDELGLHAGQDFTNITETVQSEGTVRSTVLGPRATVAVQKGPLKIRAERDVVDRAGRIGQLSTGPEDGVGIGIFAGRDILSRPVQTGREECADWSPGNSTYESFSRDVGSQVVGTGHVRVGAERDFDATGASFISKQGEVEAVGGRNVKLGAGAVRHHLSQQYYATHSFGGFFGSDSTVARNEECTRSGGIGATLSGSSGVKVTAVEGGIATEGAQLASGPGGAGVHMRAKKKIYLGGAMTREERRQHRMAESDSLLSSREVEDSAKKDVQAEVPTVVDSSSGGPITVVSGEEQALIGTQMKSQVGIVLEGQAVNVLPSHRVTEQYHHRTTCVSGLTIGASNPVYNMVQEFDQLATLAETLGDDEDSLCLLATTAALTTYNNVAEVASWKGSVDKIGGVNVGFRLGTTTTEQEKRGMSDEVLPSCVQGGQFVQILATQQDVTIKASDIWAPIIALKAKGDINMVHDMQVQMSSSRTQSESTGFGVGIGFNPSKLGKGAFSLASVGVDHSEIRANGEAAAKYVRPATLGAETVFTESGAATRVIGSEIGCDTMISKVGTDLQVESVQDEEDSRQAMTKTGFSIGVDFSGGSPAPYASVQHSRDGARAERRVVERKAGVYAKKRFDFQVKGHTELKGAEIRGGAGSVLNTETLAAGDMQNRDNYKARRLGFSAAAFGKNAEGGKSGVQFKPGAPSALQSSGSAGSVTRSVVSSGLRIRAVGAVEEKAMAARLAAGDEPACIRPLRRTYNPARVQAKFQLASALGGQVGQLISYQSAEAKRKFVEAADEEARAENYGDPSMTDEQREGAWNRAQRLRDEAETQSRIWGPSGVARQLCHALQAAAGNDVGGAGGFLPSTLTYFAQEKVASILGDLVAKGKLEEGEPLHAALHAALAFAGASLRGESVVGALAPAAAGAASSVLPRMLNTNGAKDNANLALNIIQGLAAIIAPGCNLAETRSAAALALENNYLSSKQEAEYRKKLKEAAGLYAKALVVAKYGKLSLKQNALLGAGLVVGLVEAGIKDVQGVVEFLAQPMESLRGLKRLLTEPEVATALGKHAVEYLTDKLTRIAYAFTEGDEEMAYAVGRDLGDLIWQIGSVVVAGVGLAKAGAKLARFGVRIGGQTLKAIKEGGRKVLPALLEGQPMLPTLDHFWLSLEKAKELKGMSNREKWMFAEIVGRESIESRVKAALLKSKATAGATLVEIGKMQKYGQKGIDVFYRLTKGEKVAYMTLEIKGFTSQQKKTLDGLQGSVTWLKNRIPKVGMGAEEAAHVAQLLDEGKVLSLLLRVDEFRAVTVKRLGLDGKAIERVSEGVKLIPEMNKAPQIPKH